MTPLSTIGLKRRRNRELSKTAKEKASYLLNETIAQCDQLYLLTNNFETKILLNNLKQILLHKLNDVV